MTSAWAWIGAWILLLIATHESRASMDWTDFCAPDQVALDRAARDYPSDRYDRSRCKTPVHRRGTCEVVPSEAGRASDTDPILFRVKLKNNEGAERRYDITMALDPSLPHHAKPAASATFAGGAGELRPAAPEPSRDLL